MEMTNSEQDKKQTNNRHDKFWTGQTNRQTMDMTNSEQDIQTSKQAMDIKSLHTKLKIKQHKTH